MRYAPLLGLFALGIFIGKWLSYEEKYAAR